MRPTWEEYFIGIVQATAARASCDRGRSGAIIVKDLMILSAGYVGAPRGLPDCDEVGHDLRTIKECSKGLLMGRFTLPIEIASQHCVRTVHAEMNAILNAARHGKSCMDSTMYCTMIPCRTCAMAIIQSGIKEVIALHPYHKGQESIEMFEKVGIVIKVINEKFLY